MMARTAGESSDAATDAFVAEAARQAFVRAADRLYVDPMRLAKRLGDGRLADLLIELKTASYWAYPSDRDRIDELLEGIWRDLREDVSAQPRPLPGAATVVGDDLAGEAPNRSAQQPERGHPEEVERLCRYVSHEVRNRLNLVSISLERAAMLAQDPRVRSALEPVRHALHNLGEIADLLRSDVAPPTPTTRPEPATSRLPVHTVVQEALSASRDLADREGIALELDDFCPDAEVEGARAELALVNLLTNALRYPDRHKDRSWVRVEVRPYDAAEGALRIGVLDNGVGIPARLRGSLLDAPPSDRPGVHGMGLSIVRQTVERAGGRLWLESEEGVGTQVYFTLPAGPAVSRPQAPSRPRHRSSVPASA